MNYTKPDAQNTVSIISDEYGHPIYLENVEAKTGRNLAAFSSYLCGRAAELDEVIQQEFCASDSVKQVADTDQIPSASNDRYHISLIFQSENKRYVMQKSDEFVKLRVKST